MAPTRALLVEGVTDEAGDGIGGGATDAVWVEQRRRRWRTQEQTSVGHAGLVPASEIAALDRAILDLIDGMVRVPG